MCSYDLIYPALLSGPTSIQELCLFALPARFGGFGVSDPVESALMAFSSSHEGTSVLRSM